MAPSLFFRLLSCYCMFDGSSKLTSETNLFVKGIRHFVRLFLIPNASLLLGSFITTREWQFSPHTYGKKKKVYAISSQEDFFTKSVKIYLLPKKNLPKSLPWFALAESHGAFYNETYPICFPYFSLAGFYALYNQKYPECVPHFALSGFNSLSHTGLNGAFPKGS